MLQFHVARKRVGYLKIDTCLRIDVIKLLRNFNLFAVLVCQLCRPPALGVCSAAADYGSVATEVLNFSVSLRQNKGLCTVCLPCVALRRARCAVSCCRYSWDYGPQPFANYGSRLKNKDCAGVSESLRCCKLHVRI